MPIDLRSISTPLTNDSIFVQESMDARMASTLASGCCCLGTGGPPPMNASINAFPVNNILHTSTVRMTICGSEAIGDGINGVMVMDAGCLKTAWTPEQHNNTNGKTPEGSWWVAERFTGSMTPTFSCIFAREPTSNQQTTRSLKKKGRQSRLVKAQRYHKYVRSYGRVLYE